MIHLWDDLKCLAVQATPPFDKLAVPGAEKDESGS